MAFKMKRRRRTRRTAPRPDAEVLTAEALEAKREYEAARGYAHDALPEQPDGLPGVDGWNIHRGVRVKLYRDDQGKSEVGKVTALVWTEPVATAKYPRGIFRYRIIGTSAFGTWRCDRAKLLVGHDTQESKADDAFWQAEHGLNRMWERWDEAEAREEHQAEERKAKREEKKKAKKRAEREAKKVAKEAKA